MQEKLLVFPRRRDAVESETHKKFEKIAEAGKKFEFLSLPTFARSAAYFANIDQHLGQVGRGLRCRRAQSSLLLPTVSEIPCK